VVDSITTKHLASTSRSFTMAEVFKKKLAAMKASAEEAKRLCAEAEEERDEMIRKCEETEEAAQDLQKQISELEDEIDSFESRYVAAQQELDQASSKKEEHTQLKDNLTNRVNRDEGKIGYLEAESADLEEKNQAAKDRYDDIIGELEDCEKTLEEEEEKRERLTIEVREMESKMIEVGNDLRSKQINNDQNTNRTSNAETRIETLQGRVDELLADAQKFEEQAVEMEAKQTELDDALEEVKIKHREKQSDLEDLKNMIADM